MPPQPDNSRISDAQPSSGALYRYALFTAAATFFLIVAGGLVTSTDSGLAVPDWPLSYGMLFPPMVGGIFYEHGHRMTAGAVGILIFILAGWIWAREPRVWVKRLALSAAVAVIAQALLGGLTVLLLLPPQVSIAHAFLGQTVFCLTVCIAAAVAPSWSDASAQVEDSRSPSLRALSLVLAAATLAQLALGAALRHTAMRVDAHLGGALFVLTLGAWVISRILRTRPVMPSLRAHALRAAVLILIQLALGGLSWAFRGSVSVVTAHVAVGALLLAQTVVLAWQVARSTQGGVVRELRALSRHHASA